MIYTRQDIIDAFKKNGLEWIQGNYIQYDVEYDPPRPFAGCVIGQAAVNLDLPRNQDKEIIFRHLRDFLMGYATDQAYTLAGDIEDFNDTKAVSYDMAANYAIALIERYIPEDAVLIIE